MSYRDSSLQHVSTQQAHAVGVPGATAAAILASGIGCAALGCLVILAEANEAAKAIMTLSPAVGSLSGKATFAVLAWLLSWGLFHILWREKAVALSRTYMVVLLGLIVIGVLGTFPPVYVRVAELFH